MRSPSSIRHSLTEHRPSYIAPNHGPLSLTSSPCVVVSSTVGAGSDTGSHHSGEPGRLWRNGLPALLWFTVLSHRVHCPSMFLSSTLIGEARPQLIWGRASCATAASARR